MATILLIVIYIAFIGLGIPDSLLGAAWPEIYKELDIPVSWASLISMLISGGTIISSLLSARLISRLGTGKITAVSTSMTAASLLGFSFSGNIFFLCLSAVPLGLGAGAIDTALNNYMALHYKGTHMNFLHCFYGIGISLSPFLMSFALSATSWRNGYRMVFCFQACIGLLTIVTLPLWKKVNHLPGGPREVQSRNIAFLSLIRSAKVRKSCQVFIGSCGIEYTCGVWGATFLVNARDMSASAAALVITFYYIGIAVGRFLSGLLAFRLTGRQLVRIGQGVTLAAIVLLLLPGVNSYPGIGLFCIGLGNGAVFPNMLQTTPEDFGRENSQAVMGVQMAASYIGTMLLPALFGVIAQYINAALFPFYLLLLHGFMIMGSLGLEGRKSPEWAAEG